MKKAGGLIAAGVLLLAGQALAQTADQGGQPVTDRQHIEMLFQAQHPSGTTLTQDPSVPTLTREQIAAYRDEAGWGKAFKQMQADGFFQGYKNFGQVISASRSAKKGLEVEETAVNTETGHGFKSDRPEKVKKLQRISRINRPNRPKRPKRY